MNLLSDQEKSQAATDVKMLITASGQMAKLFRKFKGEVLYGSDDAKYDEVGEIKLEFIATPPEDLNQKIDATAHIEPEILVNAEDRIQVKGDEFRVQNVKDELLFGVVTHRTIQLVRIHGR